jgi:DNA-directed RNA polymerase subunit M/transcription elongation factor TFIIS
MQASDLSLSSEQEEQPEKIARPGLFCHSCGEKGKVFEVPETVALSEGELDLPLFRCENCGVKWYAASDVVPLVVIYRLEFTKKP